MQRNLAGNEQESASASTFTAWQSQHSMAGLNNPNDDPDADGLTNLMEYALGSAPDNGLGVSRFRLENNTTTGAIDALLTRPAGEHRDLRYILEGSDDLAAWTALTIAPAVNSERGSDRNAALRQCQPAPSCVSKSRSMPISTAQAKPRAITGAQGWTRRLFPVGRQTLSMPLLLPAVYSGKISSTSGRAVVINTNGIDIHAHLQNGVSYYVEVLDGRSGRPHLDIDTAASTGSTLTLATAPRPP
jgi:hypothetical protein